MILSLPVDARARRMALMAASVPELTKRSRSIEGIASVISSPRSTSCGFGAP
jgi:hypothetical protein